MASPYRRLENETVVKWLERMIEIEAPIDIRADVRAILASNRRGNLILLYVDALSIVSFRGKKMP